MRELLSLEKKILRATGKAIEDFSLIKNGDHIALGLSGGKDSWTLLHILMLLRERAPITFSLTALTIHPGFPEFDTTELERYLTEHKLEHVIKRTHINETIRDRLKPGSSFCSFCARLRRGALYTTAPALGCNKIALAHHREDTIETLLLNQFFSGKIKAMPAMLVSDDRKNIVIRPFIYVPEEEIAEYARLKGFPILHWQCPIASEENGERKKVKRMLAGLEQEYPGLKSTMLSALQNVHLSHLLDKNVYSGAIPEEDL